MQGVPGCFTARTGLLYQARAWGRGCECARRVGLGREGACVRDPELAGIKEADMLRTEACSLLSCAGKEGLVGQGLESSFFSASPTPVPEGLASPSVSEAFDGGFGLWFNGSRRCRLVSFRSPVIFDLNKCWRDLVYRPAFSLSSVSLAAFLCVQTESVYFSAPGQCESSRVTLILAYWLSLFSWLISFISLWCKHSLSILFCSGLVPSASKNSVVFILF